MPALYNLVVKYHDTTTMETDTLRWKGILLDEAIRLLAEFGKSKGIIVLTSNVSFAS